MEKMKTIAHIRTQFPEKFGLPRQAGLVNELEGTVVFEPEYRVKEAFRGLENFSHIWIIWEFSEAVREDWSPTVRPPRLGGNTRVGVFATRSPFRPNPIAMSAVKLEGIELDTPDGPVLHVSGIDMMDGTPVYDIKPYIPYADIRSDATGSFAAEKESYRAEVHIDESYRTVLGDRLFEGLKGVLAQDPRPSYKNTTDGTYGMTFAGFNISFEASDGILTVTSVSRDMHR